MGRWTLAALSAAGVACVVVGMTSCGGDDSASTSADASSKTDSAPPDTSTSSADAAQDASLDTGADAAPDAPVDAAADVSVDAPADAFDASDGADADAAPVIGPAVFRGAFVGGGAAASNGNVKLHGVFHWHGAVRGQNNGVRISGWLQ